MDTASHPPKLTVVEKLNMISTGLSLIASTIYVAITGVFRGQRGQKHYNKHVGYALIRAAVTRLSTRQLQ